jgi:hypothetical protein
MTELLFLAVLIGMFWTGHWLAALVVLLLLSLSPSEPKPTPYVHREPGWWDD